MLRDALVAQVVPDHDETPGVKIGEWTNQDGIDRTENGGVRPDAQREREHRDGGEAGVLQQLAERVAKVVMHDRQAGREILDQSQRSVERAIPIRRSTNQNKVATGVHD